MLEEKPLPAIDLLTDAARISKILAAHAATHDREGSFPIEGVNAILASPINTAVLEGCSWSTFSKIVAILAKGDPSAATAWLMHQGAGIVFKSLPDPAMVAFFDAEFRRGAWFGNALSEPTGGNQFLMPLQEAERVEGGFRFTGVKRFVTNCERANYFLTAALCDGKPEFFLIDKDSSIRIEEMWDAMGMRGTRSQAIHMTDTLLPDARKVTRALEKPNPIPAGLPALSLGIAEAALDFIIGYAKERKLPQQNVPISTMQWVQFAVADMSIELDAATALNDRSMAAADAGDPMAGILQFKAKVAANMAASNITTMALRIAGGAGYLARLPLERHLRDAMSGQIMALSTEVIRGMVGRMLLEVPPGA